MPECLLPHLERLTIASYMPSSIEGGSLAGERRISTLLVDESSIPLSFGQVLQVISIYNEPRSWIQCSIITRKHPINLEITATSLKKIIFVFIDMDGNNYALIYTPSFLSYWYDLYVLGFNMRYLWGCPTTPYLLPFFTENFSRNHLDCGVATGYFPAHALSTIWRRDSKQRLVLLDINSSSLLAAKLRIQAVTTSTEIECIEADVTAQIPLAIQSFSSISMFNLFHCIPGGDKLKAISAFAMLLENTGVLVGCTILGAKHSTSPTWLRTMCLKIYNSQWGVFNNWDDTHDDFKEALQENFYIVETWVVGMMLLFRAQNPRRARQSRLP